MQLLVNRRRIYSVRQKAAGMVTIAPTARSVTYTGSAQYLVTAGSGTGTIYYRYRYKSYSSSSFGGWSSYSTSRPSRTNAGYYEIQYYAAESEDYTQSEVGLVQMSMARADRTLTFNISSYSLLRNSSKTLTPTISAGSDDGTINYVSAATSVVTVNSSGVITAVSDSGSATVTATISGGNNYNDANSSVSVSVSNIVDFAYTGAVQDITLGTGTYKLEVWGAQGGNAYYSSEEYKVGGRGGYSEGILTLSSSRTLFIFVGGKPSQTATNGGWNGGGGASKRTNTVSAVTYCRIGMGGGATDIALTTSTMNYNNYRTDRSAASYKSRFIVAGGGSGGKLCKTLNDPAVYASTYVGGGVNGGASSNTVRATQIASGTPDATTRGGFGYGASAYVSSYMIAGAGGGWYGGANRSSGVSSTTQKVGGGSGFVNIAANASYRPSGYTGVQLDSGATYDGDTEFPAPGGGTETGHGGSGYARITRIS